MTLKESQIEQSVINKLEELKYIHRPNIRDKASLEQNFRGKFEALNHVRLSALLKNIGEVAEAEVQE